MDSPSSGRIPAVNTTVDPILNPCRPSAASIKETCENLPQGTGPVMFPVPVLEYFVQCSPTSTCEDARAMMMMCKDVFDVAIIVLVLLLVVACVLRLHFQYRERQAYRLMDSDARDLET